KKSLLPGYNDFDINPDFTDFVKQTALYHRTVDNPSGLGNFVHFWYTICDKGYDNIKNIAKNCGVNKEIKYSGPPGAGAGVGEGAGQFYDVVLKNSDNLKY